MVPTTEELKMDVGENTLIWIIVALAVIAAGVVAVVMMRRSSQTAQADRLREEARDLREQADAERIELQRREADAARMDAEARLARADADARAADAAALADQAKNRAHEVGLAGAEVDERLRRADELDPDVPDGMDGRNDVDRPGTRRGAHVDHPEAPDGPRTEPLR